jgi:hypothetical protein
VRIEIGVTHQVRINGESAWIKLSVENEIESEDLVTIDDATDELSKFVNNKVIEICQQTADTVNKFTGGK